MPLRKSYLGRQRGSWTKDEITEGVLEFLEINGRFPKAVEFDAFDYLPSARSIQRSFGGLLQLKKELGIEEDYHKGQYRSQIGFSINNRALIVEEKLGKFLDKQFGEVCVHREQRASSKNKQRLDFVVYYRGGKFGADIFYADTLLNLRGCLNIKQKKYHDFADPIFLISANEQISQKEIDGVVCRKTSELDRNVKVLSLGAFEERVGEFETLSVR